ncbi:multiple epidermal growth factor-like domains protein 10 [Saccostrea cucullata]|uniref:multiple epidermal growth factor-like domains protein 10 n=1 Tax=Saccostrea cuccullata TaxID=36930 RepID=UPI002ED31FDA
MKFISKVILFGIIVRTQSGLSIQGKCLIKGYQCCYNQYLNDTTKECSDCPAGSIGWNCKQKCPLGYYGRLCQSPCECQASNCHHVIGCTTGNTVI